MFLMKFRLYWMREHQGKSFPSLNEETIAEMLHLKKIKTLFGW